MITMEVTLNFTPTQTEITKAWQSYEATPKQPVPDGEWLMEEIAMSRIELVEGVMDICVIDPIEE